MKCDECKFEMKFVSYKKGLKKYKCPGCGRVRTLDYNVLANIFPNPRRPR